MKKISIGMIGAGFAAHLHGDCLKEVPGLDIDLAIIADINIESARKVAGIYGYRNYTDNYKEILHDENIGIVSILNVGKHVICEKPLPGYFGELDDEQPIGDKVSKLKMYEKVMSDLQKIDNSIKQSNKFFMYAENYIYSPNVQKAAEMIQKKKSKILFMKGEESVQGSPSGFAGSWDKTGGGTLLRIGCHPLGGILYLKNIEAKTKGIEIKVKSVIADTGRISPTLTQDERKYLRANPLDVEDFGTMTITFTDDTKATIFANDNVLGGIKNYIEIYSNNSTMLCNITPTDTLQTYFLDQDGLEDVYISEKLDHKTGWNNVFVSESIQRGYVNQMKDFLECVAYGKEPKSNFDIAAEVTKVMYAAYVSAESGKRIDLLKNNYCQ